LRAERRIFEENKVISNLLIANIILQNYHTFIKRHCNRGEHEGISLNTYIITLLSEKHVERKILKEVVALKRMLEIMNTQIMSGTYNASHYIHKIEERIDKYRGKKNKKS